MKTLDEVIEIFEKVVKHDYVWFDEKTALMTIETMTDALQYLREYQWQMTNPDGDHQQLEKCRALLQDFYRNDPLSWEELQQMEGKPVWIEEYDAIDSTRGWRCCRWMLVEFINDSYMDARNSDGEQYNFDKGEETWQAYRKERL